DAAAPQGPPGRSRVSGRHDAATEARGDSPRGASRARNLCPGESMIPNMWYAICRPQDVPRREPVGLRRMGEDLVLFRDATGRVVCMQDRCAHKGAKLSARLPGISRLTRNIPQPGRIACPYHGFEYDAKGDCVAIPALGDGAKIPKGMCLKAYRVA